jgi:hypothetical protein
VPDAPPGEADLRALARAFDEAERRVRALLAEAAADRRKLAVEAVGLLTALRLLDARGPVYAAYRTAFPAVHGGGTGTWGHPLRTPQSNFLPQPKLQASAISPDVIANAPSDMLAMPVAVFVSTALHAVSTFVGCSGNVEPGDPRSAEAGAAAAAISASVAAPASRRRLMVTPSCRHVWRFVSASQTSLSGEARGPKWRCQ